MLIVTVRLSRAFTGCRTISAAAQKDAEHIQRHEAGEIPATLPTKNAGTMAPAFFFFYIKGAVPRRAHTEACAGCNSRPSRLQRHHVARVYRGEDLVAGGVFFRFFFG